MSTCQSHRFNKTNPSQLCSLAQKNFTTHKKWLEHTSESETIESRVFDVCKLFSCLTLKWQFFPYWNFKPLRPEATITQCLIWKRGVSKRGILKSLVSHVLILKNMIKLIQITILTVTSVRPYSVRSCVSNFFLLKLPWNPSWLLGSTHGVDHG